MFNFILVSATYLEKEKVFNYLKTVNEPNILVMKSIVVEEKMNGTIYNSIYSLIRGY